MQDLISVIICSHNPREAYLKRVLGALSEQTLPLSRWELLVIDNASSKPLASTFDLSWHPQARFLHEGRLGKTHACLQGISVSSGELLIFVDDDNVLAKNYLAEAWDIAEHRSEIGAFGGSIKGEFETVPPSWVKPFLPNLALTEIERDYWGNIAQISLAVPVGAGLCVRRNVAQDYAKKLKVSPQRRRLDRIGSSLSSCGDTDLAWCAVDLGLGTGRFCKLHLTHLIPKERLSRKYTIKLQAGLNVSFKKLESLRGDPSSLSRSLPTWRSVIRNLILAKPLEREIFFASRREQKAAIKMINTCRNLPE